MAYDDIGIGSIGVKVAVAVAGQTAKPYSGFQSRHHHHASLSFLFSLSCPIHDCSRPGELSHTLAFQLYDPRRCNRTTIQTHPLW